MFSGGVSLWLALFLMIAVVWLFSRSRSLREQSGLPDGEVIYTDTGTWFPNKDVLHSAELRLVGKPDYLVEQPDGMLVPVEIKSGRAPAQPREGHVLQLAAYCLLIEENFGLRPEVGILQYKDKAFAVDYTTDLEDDLLDLLLEMRHATDEDELERDHYERARCAACGVRRNCHQRLA
jgi:CRISPR-associated exonuclease Cas4